jgi:hypothetical protein
MIPIESELSSLVAYVAKNCVESVPFSANKCRKEAATLMYNLTTLYRLPRDRLLQQIYLKKLTVKILV